MPVAAAKLSAAMWNLFGAEVISTAFPRIKALKRKPVDVQLCCSTLGIRVFEDSKDGGLIEDEPIEQVRTGCSEQATVNNTISRRSQAETRTLHVCMHALTWTLARMPAYTSVH